MVLYTCHSHLRTKQALRTCGVSQAHKMLDNIHDIDVRLVDAKTVCEVRN